MKYLLLFAIALLFIGCNSTEEKENPVIIDHPRDKSEATLEEIMISHIESKLNINAIEKYDYAVYKEELNRDDSTDWVITVNLLDRALNDAAKTGREKQMETVGYMGHYNYIFYMDGKTKQFSPAVVVPSSAYAPLIVNFENITSTTKKDFTIDLKIRNSRRRLFYMISDNKPLQMCEEVVFYNFGKEDAETEAFSIEFEEVENSTIKNILVYEAELEQVAFDNSTDVYKADPEITSTEKLVRRWYFNPQMRKYFMKKGEL